jgi:hypothetical protein
MAGPSAQSLSIVSTVDERVGGGTQRRCGVLCVLSILSSLLILTSRRAGSLRSLHAIIFSLSRHSTRSSFFFDDRQCHALSEHPHLYTRVQREPSYDAPPRARLGACAWRIH